MLDDDDKRLSPEGSPEFSTLLNRRDMMKGALAAGAVLSVPASGYEKSKGGFLPFGEINSVQKNDIQLADGFEYTRLISFGDPIKPGLAAHDPAKLSSDQQKVRFGGNNDYSHFYVDPKNPDKGILCVNHESPEYGRHPDKKERQGAAYYSVGASVLAVKKQGGKWVPDLNSNYNRRIHPDTAGIMTGPAAGSDRMKNGFSKDGIKTAGTLGNCAGGFTPWGTYLTAEENFQNYFAGNVKNHKEKENMKRYGCRGRKTFFADEDPRFNVDSKDDSFLHYGWVVEIDPYNPDSPIKKHSLLGRAKHESASVTLTKDNHAVVYTGDDQAFEYIYKFVSEKKYIEGNRKHNLTLLESGTLYVAQFQKGGVLKWLPLVYGKGPLTKKNGFNSQSDVLIDTRKAADLLGATPMDRPEDIEISPKNGKAYFLMTGNRGRNSKNVNVANSVAAGAGHIIEIDSNHHLSEVKWTILVNCGQSNKDKKNSVFHQTTSASGQFVYPDNAEFDHAGNMWICSDGYGFKGFKDGLWHLETEGKNRGLSRRLATPPHGAEFTGPSFTPDDSALFLCVQHPRAVAKPYFPDFGDKPPRSSVVVIQRKS